MSSSDEAGFSLSAPTECSPTSSLQLVVRSMPASERSHSTILPVRFMGLPPSTLCSMPSAPAVINIIDKYDAHLYLIIIFNCWEVYQNLVALMQRAGMSLVPSLHQKYEARL